MIVPDFWAEARKHHRDGKKQFTVRRFGWSNVSQSEALAMAESRVADALARLIAGEKIDRRERKATYNGAFGVPIREEVLSRHGEEVVTRNSYGAHCLNTPRALFADIDFDPQRSGKDALIAFAVMAAGCTLVGLQLHRWGLVFGLLVISLFLSASTAAVLRRMITALRGGPNQLARQRVIAFLAEHPSWNLRLYKTPNGIRLLVTHQPYESNDPEVKRFFAAVGTDPIYARMCANQRCFRARLTAKPWRIGIPDHMRPRPGIWPVNPARRNLREHWVAQYEQRAAGFAACHFVESLGSGTVHQDLLQVIELHDRESRATQPAFILA
ncbi:MAG: hypothetical protein AB9M53_09610 [Leptothrix sp. (in: b-proteobacteria)]